MYDENIRRLVRAVEQVFEKRPDLRDSWVRYSLLDFFEDTSTGSYRDDLISVVTAFAPHTLKKKEDKNILLLYTILLEIGKAFDKKFGDK